MDKKQCNSHILPLKPKTKLRIPVIYQGFFLEKRGHPPLNKTNC